MSAPAVLLVFFFLVAPFFMAIAFAFTNQRLFSPNPTEYVGAENFKRMLGVYTLTLEPVRNDDGSLILDEDGQPTYPRLRNFTRNNADYPHLNKTREWMQFDLGGNRRLYVLARDVILMKAFVNTVLFVAIVAPVQSGLALVLALMINQPLRGINLFRAIYFMPVVISMVVVSMLWRFIYDWQNGLLNSILGFFSFGFFQPVDWLGQTSTALGSIIAMSVWQGVGFHMVIWLAGLQTIPASLYEAART